MIIIVIIASAIIGFHCKIKIKLVLIELFIVKGRKKRMRKN